MNVIHKKQVQALGLVFSLFFASQAQAINSYASGVSTQVAIIDAGDPVRYSSSSSNSADITAPEPGGRFFQVNTAGTYFIVFQVRAKTTNYTPSDTLIFDLTSNGTFIPKSRFQSFPSGGEYLSVSGQVTVTLAAGSKIRLRNWTKHAGVGTSVTLAPIVAPDEDNASISIIRQS